MTGYTVRNDCAAAVAESLPLTLWGDVWDDRGLRMDGAVVFVFPFEKHLHDYAHVQYMLKSLLDIISSHVPMPFRSYTSVYLYASNTDHIRSASRHMARDAEVVLLTAPAPWLNATSSPRFACSTLQQAEKDRGIGASACAADACHEAAQEQGAKDQGAVVGDEALQTGSAPLMVAVAVGASGKCG
jgi:hypothetical protein